MGIAPWSWSKSCTLVQEWRDIFLKNSRESLWVTGGNSEKHMKIPTLNGEDIIDGWTTSNSILRPLYLRRRYIGLQKIWQLCWKWSYHNTLWWTFKKCWRNSNLGTTHGTYMGWGKERKLEWNYCLVRGWEKELATRGKRSSNPSTFWFKNQKTEANITFYFHFMFILLVN